MKQLPSHLRPESKRWIHDLEKTFVLEEHHLRLLILAAEAWERCAQAREILAKEGIVFKDKYKQKKAHPAVNIERDSRIAFARLLRETGLETEGVEPPRAPRVGGKK